MTNNPTWSCSELPVSPLPMHDSIPVYTVATQQNDSQAEKLYYGNCKL